MDQLPDTFEVISLPAAFFAVKVNVLEEPEDNVISPPSIWRVFTVLSSGVVELSVTVTLHVALLPPAVAVISAWPAEIPLTVPLSTVAMRSSLDSQVTSPAPAGVTVADKEPVSPTAKDIVDLSRLTSLTVGAVTSTSIVAVLVVALCVLGVLESSGFPVVAGIDTVTVTVVLPAFSPLIVTFDESLVAVAIAVSADWTLAIDAPSGLESVTSLDLLTSTEILVSDKATSSPAASAAGSIPQSRTKTNKSDKIFRFISSDPFSEKTCVGSARIWLKPTTAL